MKYDLGQAAEILRRTPDILRAMLAGLDDSWTRSNYGEDTFSPYDVIGHLITGERTDWLARARIILEQGVSRPFDKYDRYAQFEESRGKSMGQLLDEFEQLRKANVATLERMSPNSEQLAKKGMHPALGVVTLEQLLATWVAHDLNHIAQIARCMATQYEYAVGPWRKYLSVLNLPVSRMDADGAARRKAALARVGAE